MSLTTLSVTTRWLLDEPIVVDMIDDGPKGIVYEVERTYRPDRPEQTVGHWEFYGSRYDHSVNSGTNLYAISSADGARIIAMIQDQI